MTTPTPLRFATSEERRWFVIGQVEGATSYVAAALRTTDSCHRVAQKLQAWLDSDNHIACRLVFQDDQLVWNPAEAPRVLVVTKSDTNAIDDQIHALVKTLAAEDHTLSTGVLPVTDREAVVVAVCHRSFASRQSLENMVHDVLSDVLTDGRSRLDHEADYEAWRATAVTSGAWEKATARLQAIPSLRLDCERAPRPDVVPTTSKRSQFRHQPDPRWNTLSGEEREGAMVLALSLVLGRFGGSTHFILGMEMPRPAQPGWPSYGLREHWLTLVINLDEAAASSDPLAWVSAQTKAARSYGGFDRGSLTANVGNTDIGRPGLFQFGCRILRPDDGIDRTRLVDHLPSFERLDAHVSLIPDESPRLFVDYSPQLYSDQTIEKISAAFWTVLAQLIGPATPQLSSIELVSRTEAAQRGTGSEAPMPAEAWIASFATTATRQEDRIALRFDKHETRYGDLWESVRKLASALRGYQSTRIGIYVPRSDLTVTSLLGVLSAGAAYVPFDTDAPMGRTKSIAQDASISSIVTTEDNAALFAELDIPSLLVRRDAAPHWTTTAQPPNPTDAKVTPSLSDTAYVIYTSGSTGRPKGVVVSHRAVAAFASTMTRRHRFDTTTTTLAVAPFSFDMSGFDIFPTLGAGGTIIIATANQTRDGWALSQLIEEHAVTMMKATPSTFRLLLEAGWAGSKTMTLISGGDYLPTSVANQLYEKVGRVFNVYGPTENTVHCLEHRIREQDLGGVIPIGRPVENTRVSILDESGRHVPEGVFGELYLAGEQLASGYLNRPALNEEKFVADKLNPGKVAYRTGDYARFITGNDIEFGGRRDSQVKLRGHRIELGEISSTLERHQDVGQAVAMVREDIPGHQTLVAYVVPAPQRDPDTTRLRRDLEELLPAYMLPNAIVRLEKIPLSDRGKVQRSALPAPTTEGTTTDGGFSGERPQSGLCVELSKLWSELLGVKPPDYDEDFFSLGGHSLVAMRMLSRVERDYGVRLTLAALFPRLTVRRLATIIMSQEPSTRHRLVSIAEESNTRNVFCIHPVSGQVTVFPNLVEGLSVDCSFFAIETSREYPNDVSSLRDLASEYVELIRQKQPDGPYLVAGTSMGALIAFEVALLLEQAAERVDALVIIDCAPKAVILDKLASDDEELLLHRAVRDLRAHKLGLAAFPATASDCSVEQLKAADDPFELAIETLLKDGIITADVPAEIARRLVRTTMCNLHSLERYVLPTPVRAPIAFIRNTCPSGMPYTGRRCTNDDGVWGWSQWTMSEVDGPYDVPNCDHWTMLRKAETMKQVGQHLSTILKRAWRL